MNQAIDDLVARLIKLVRRAKRLSLVWSTPPTCDVLIAFSDSANSIQNYFNGRKCLTLNIDEGERYVWMMIRSILKGRRGLDGYISEVALKSKARIIISMQDNLSALYRVRQWLPDTPVALIQNGLRSIRGDLHSVIRSSDVTQWHIDYYFGFTQESCDHVGTLASNRIPIGSFRSNCTPKSPRAKDAVLSYISTLRTDIPMTTLIGDVEKSTSTTYEDILQERLRILREVLRIGQSLGLHSRILGKGPEHHAEELFYREHLQGFDFEFVPRIDISTQYLQVDRSTITVSTSSTLGYESLARGNRTAVLHPDSQILQDPSLRFGWPIEMAPEGSFWSTSASSLRINEVLRFVYSATDLQWRAVINQAASALPRFDPGNTRLVHELSRWGAQPPLGHGKLRHD